MGQPPTASNGEVPVGEGANSGDPAVNNGERSRSLPLARLTLLRDTTALQLQKGPRRGGAGSRGLTWLPHRAVGKALLSVLPVTGPQ